MDLTKYANDGWGISKQAFIAIEKALSSLDDLSVIEFGSGFSTQFFLDYASEHEKALHLDSFDNDKKYKHNEATLCDLMECKDAAYEAMFSKKQLDWSLMKKRFWRPKSRQKNCFYRIDESKLKNNYNFAMIDGPHGNGRNLAFLLLQHRMSSGFIFIDDFNHYDFLEKAHQFFNLTEIERVEKPKDNYVLLKIN